MSFVIILRLLVMVVLAFLGWEAGEWIARWLPVGRTPVTRSYYRLFMTFIGALIGFFSAPYLTVVPYRALRRRLHEVSARALIMGVVGLVVGLIIAALLALPLSLLPGMWGQVLPFVAAAILGALGTAIMVVRDRDILAILGLFLARDTIKGKRNLVLLDTSVIIDGRVADICQTGFIGGTMIVPRFVLEELQHIADSTDVLRRNRGRRGLDVLNKMQKNERIPLEISEMDVLDIREVDGKLIKLAQELDCPVLTNDYNLNRVAELQGVRVLNINELANAVKAIVLPGETLRVQIIQEGKELGQGVGYLDDGTMIVVEDGRRHMNATVDITVTRVLQTVAGRMIFGQPQKTSGEGA
jgi:uncharacterized protein YacL